MNDSTALRPARVTELNRRDTLLLLASSALPPASLLATPTARAANIPVNVVTVLYRKEGPQAPSRVDPVVQAATLALEDELIKKGMRVVQPSPEAYRVMDAGQGVVVTFAPDAGLSLVYSVYKDLRPTPGVEAGIAEVRLQARIFVGRAILAAEEGRGQMYTRLEASVREFGERRAMELAARKASADLAERLLSQVRTLTPEQIQSMSQYGGNSIGSSTEVALPAVPPPPPPAPVNTASPPVVAAPIPAPTPVPVPVPTPTPAPVAQAPNAPPPSPEVAPLPVVGQRYALLVGVSDYSGVRARGAGAGDLAGVAKDLPNISSALQSCGFERENIYLQFNEKATSSNVRTMLKVLAGKMQPNDLFVLFMSAHGGSKEGSYSGFGLPILSDFDPKRVEDALDFWELQSLTQNMRVARTVWMIDTCHSGGAAQDLTTVEISSRGVNATQGVAGPDPRAVTQTTRSSGHHFAVMTASRPEEVSWEDGEKGGLFTSRLADALRTSRGKAPLEDLFRQKIVNQVVEGSRAICRRRNDCKAPQQTPVFGYTGSGNLLTL
jgi:hypothetical protein